MEKRTQTERLIIAETLVSGVYQESREGKTEDILQEAFSLHIRVNQLVWWLNKKMNGGKEHEDGGHDDRG